MTVLDAYALVALLAGEAAADEVEALLRSPGGVEMASVNLAEAVDVVGRVHGVQPVELRRVIDPLLVGSIRVVAVTTAHALRAAELRVRHYHRRSSPLSLADCVALAVCTGGRRLATADPDLARMARAEAAEVIALPDRAGRRP